MVLSLYHSLPPRCKAKMQRTRKSAPAAAAGAVGVLYVFEAAGSGMRS